MPSVVSFLVKIDKKKPISFFSSLLAFVLNLKILYARERSQKHKLIWNKNNKILNIYVWTQNEKNKIKSNSVWTCFLTNYFTSYIEFTGFLWTTAHYFHYNLSLISVLFISYFCWSTKKMLVLLLSIPPSIHSLHKETKGHISSTSTQLVLLVMLPH